MRILVVEDDKELNRQVTEALQDAGYVVDRAFDGEEGHFLGDTEPYDAVVLDIGLPLDAAEVAALPDAVLQAVAAVAGVVAIIGRISARDRIG